MKLTPLETLPLRVRLKAENRLSASRVGRRPEFLIRREVAAACAYMTTPGGGFDTVVTEVHPYALVGHQVTGWTSGHLWARDLGLPYVGGALSRDPEGLFTFPSAKNSSQKRHPSNKILHLPPVPDERDPTALALLQAAITRGRRRFPEANRVFRLSLDQARWDLTPAGEVLRQAVLRGRMGPYLQTAEEGPPFMAVHVRRGDDVGPSTHPDRWLSDAWYVPLIRRLRRQPGLRGLPVRVYALGSHADFPLLSREEGVELRLDGDRDHDFADLCAARLLVVAPSSFSYNAALVSRGIALMRAPWWHHVPNGGRWVHLDEHGGYAESDLTRAADS